jgi:hypothetical protein
VRVSSPLSALEFFFQGIEIWEGKILENSRRYYNFQKVLVHELEPRLLPPSLFRNPSDLKLSELQFRL